ncbi:enoyl-CoA hydratase/isomerase family protein [Polymorphospora lycopeni]|uniref:Enoyl-CoA hydratase/isomerase family protein n=1 Tax=Polymorphospora lycopeni TaxID=3140240 RepID=A0ABV5D405_9ACTN
MSVSRVAGSVATRTVAGPDAPPPPTPAPGADPAPAVLTAVEPYVVRATINRPARRNAIDLAVIEGLERAIDLADATGARALVLRGAAGTFCAGADLRVLEEMSVDPHRVETFMVRLALVLRRLETARFVSVAVVEGHAVAGGCEILLACDISVAATDARIGDRHLEYGLAPAAGGSVRLARTLPKARGNYLLLTADLLTGREAADWGLVSVAVPPADLESRVDALVDRLAGHSADALAVVKKMVWTADHEPRPDAMSWERRLFLRHLGSDDVSEGLRAFRERRRPAFRADD